MAAVVVILDRSLSMPMNGLYFGARSRAIEIADGLARPGSPDHLGAFVVFGTKAELVETSQVSQIEWDYDYGSNLEDALRLGLSVLGGRPGRMVVLSDLFVDAHTDEAGDVVFRCPPDPDTLERTVDAIRSCRDALVTIEALRYLSGEWRDEDEEEQVAILDAIVTAGGTIEDVHVGEAAPSTWPDRPWRHSG